MDLDKPLDDMIPSKKREQKPRQSRDRRDQAPYARPPPRSTEDKWVHDAYQGGGNRRGPAGGAGGRQAAESGGYNGVPFTGVSPRIEVIGLHYEVTPQDLKTIFAQAGTLVQGPTIRYDFSGRSKGEATMEFASYQQAKIAINKFDGAMTKGQTISIRLLPPVQQRAPSGGKPQQGASSGDLLARISGGTPPVSGPRGDGGGAPRGERGGRGGRGAPRGRGAAGPARGGGRKAPASAGDLDSELDSFMKNDSKAGDVEMA